MIHRRTLPLLALPGLAQAQAWPSRPITLVVPFAAGGNVDAVTRLLAPELAHRLGQNVMVDNAPGAGGTIATERVARAAPDGNTLLVAVESTLAIAPFVAPSAVRYDPVADFAPVAMLATLPLALVGRPDLPAADLPALIALARASSAGLTYATSGTGTSLHLLGEIIAARTGARLEHVPYRITSQIPTDLMGGRLDLAILALTVAAPLVREGRIKGFAVSAANPHPAMPAVPPLASLPAMAGFEMAVWQGIFAPARTDAAIVERLAAEIQMAMEEPETQRRLAGIGMTASQLSLAALGRLLRAEMTRYEAVVRAANIRLD
jgi:tripartite-type tricarboxylate transporter receptor subunit TctC